MSKMDVKGGTSKLQDYDQSLAMYLQTTDWPLRFDCSPYSQPISLKVGYIFVATLSLPSMYSDLFYLENSFQKREISCFLYTPSPYLNNISPPSLWAILYM